MKSEEEVLNDYFEEKNFDSYMCGYCIKKTFDFQAYQCHVRWKEFKAELFDEIEKLFFWRKK